MNKIFIDPWFLTGFTDGDGCFSLSIFKAKDAKQGYKVKQVFQIKILNTPENYKFLESVQDLFNGHIDNNGRYLIYVVSNLEDLVKIKDFFLLYPQQTTKRIQFEAWCKALDLVQAKKHLTLEGLEFCVALKGYFPLGLNPNLNSAFPHVKPFVMPDFIPDSTPLDPNWISGFVSADGSFSFSVKRKNTKTYFSPDFRIVQHSRSFSALERIQNILGGSINPLKDNFVLRINNTQFIIDKIIPFFINSPLHGTKVSDFNSFCEIIKIIQSGRHLTNEGVKEICDIISKMNSNRYSK